MKQTRRLQASTDNSITASQAIKRSGMTTSSMVASSEAHLVGLLNSPRGPIVKRVTEVIDALKRLNELANLINFGALSADRSEVQELGEVAADLNGRLSKFRWYPVVRAVMGCGSNFDIRYEAICETKEDALESVAVRWSLENVDAIHRVRQCQRDTCRRWFFGKTDHQKFCSDLCRKNSFETGAEFKEGRRLYMREYRRKERQKDQLAKRIVKGKSR